MRSRVLFPPRSSFMECWIIKCCNLVELFLLYPVTWSQKKKQEINFRSCTLWTLFFWTRAVICGCTWFYATPPALYSSRTTGLTSDERCLNAAVLEITNVDPLVVSACVREKEFELFLAQTSHDICPSDRWPAQWVENIVASPRSPLFQTPWMKWFCLLNKTDGFVWMWLLYNQDILWCHIQWGACQNMWTISLISIVCNEISCSLTHGSPQRRKAKNTWNYWRWICMSDLKSPPTTHTLTLACPRKCF